MYTTLTEIFFISVANWMERCETDLHHSAEPRSHMITEKFSLANNDRKSYHWEYCSHWVHDHWRLQYWDAVTAAVTDEYWEMQDSRLQYRWQTTAQTPSTNTQQLRSVHLQTWIKSSMLFFVNVFRPHCIDAAYCYTCHMFDDLSVCVCAGHTGEPCDNGWTNWDAVWEREGSYGSMYYISDTWQYDYMSQQRGLISNYSHYFTL